MRNTWKVGARRAIGTAAALALLGAAGGAPADPTTMAPPVEPGYSQPDYDSGNYDSTTDNSVNYDTAAYDGAGGVASQDSVFNWREVPAQQRVPVRRAVFDQGGYQLYDTAGETIVVPFTNHNLYVMKFAPSDDGTLYFVNEGNAPVLYVPDGGYLENASVPGARWFPFSQDFHPSQPVFVGIAPSWDEFCDMGWYPRMHCYGGFWGYHSFLSGGVFLPSVGLAIFIGGHPYRGWEPYHDFYRYHNAPYHVTIVNNNYYRFGGLPDPDRGPFHGVGRGYMTDRHFGDHNHDNRPSGGDHTSGNRPFGGDRSFAGGDRTLNGGRPYRGQDHTFNGGRPVDGGRGTDGGHPFSGDTSRPYYAHHTFNGGRDSVDAQPPAGGRDNQARPFSGDRSYPGGRSFSGGQPPQETVRVPQGGDHAFSGGRDSRGRDGGHAFSGGDRVFSGGGRSYSDSGRSNSGGGRPNSGSSPSGNNSSAGSSSANHSAPSGRDSRGGGGRENNGRWDRH